MIKRLIKGVAVVLAMAVTMPIASGLKPYVLFAASGDVVINSTNFPDESFREYVGTTFDIDADGVLSEEEIEKVTRIDLGLRKPACSDLSGIGIFYNLKDLWFNNNNVTSLDLSGLTKLKSLDCRMNKLTSLNVQDCGELESLDCYGNGILSLDLSSNTILQLLDCGSNEISSLNLKNNIHLRFLTCSFNSLSTLDLSTNILLTVIKCDFNNLESLDLSSNKLLKHLICDGNNLRSLDLSGNELLQTVSCVNTNLTSLDLSGNPHLEEVYCPYNSLTSLDLSMNTKLEIIDCSYNSLTSLVIPGNESLTKLKCDNNSLNSLNISECSNLKELRCGNNDLTSLDISNNPNLETIRCDDGVTLIEPNNNQTENSNNNQTENPNNNQSENPNNNQSENTNTNEPVDSNTNQPVDSENSNGDQSAVGIEAFVRRLYTVALGRTEVEEEGLINWMNQLRSRVETGGAAARFFCTCQEMINRNLSNEDYVEMLYNLFFGRASDAPGKADWLGRLNAGASRESILDGFINSIEWANICASYGIESGGTAQPNLEPTENINAFIERIYTKCLGRGSDPTGLDRWGREIVNRRMTATEVAYGFFFSDEFLGFGLSDEEYIERLYLTFIDRPSDEVGRNDWLNRLSSGASRQDVFFGIANSNEFNGICESYGIYN